MNRFHKSLAARILRELSNGPATNADLQELLTAHSGEIARDCSKLTRRGLVRRIDGGGGRGSKAVYARAS